MMKKIILQTFLLGLCSCYYAQQIETQTRDDAGEYGEIIKSGFFHTSNPINYPPGATNWWHLLDVKHDNPGNNYAMQFSGSFSDQELWFRKLDNNASQEWSKILMERPNGNVGIGTISPASRLDINADGSIPIIRGNGGAIPSGLTFIDDSYTSQGQVREWSIFKGNEWIKGLGFMRYDAVNKCAGGICDLAFALYDNGDSQIGYFDTMFTVLSKMVVQGNVKVDAKLEAKEVKVTTSPTADFVFEDNYRLPSLEELEKHIKTKKHLPEIASAKEMEKEGVNIGEFQIQLLQKIEELTLYSIEQNKQIKALLDRLEKLEQSSIKP
ncbi:hypothetical protein [Chryseobacterium sp. T1]